MATTDQQITKKAVDNAYTIQLVEKLLGNPFLWIVGGTLIIEQLEYRGYVGNIIATSAETALFLAAIAKSLGPEGISAAGTAISDVITAGTSGLKLLPGI